MPHVYTGRVQRIVDANTLDVLLDLGLGVHVRRQVRVAGVFVSGSPDKQASHCLVILAGGKEVVCAVYREEPDAMLLARVFAPEHVPTDPPIDLVTIAEHPRPVVDVGAWMSWSAAHGFDPKALRMRLK